MISSGRGSGAPLARVLVATLIAVAGAGCDLVLGPRYAINQSLDAIAEEGIADEAEGTDLSYRFVSRTVEVEGSRATVYARGEVSGSYRGVELECICVEAIPLRRLGGEWRVEGSPLPRLEAVVAALEARRRAFEQGDLEAYRSLIHPDYEDLDEGTAIESRLAAVLADGGMEGVRQDVARRTLRVERHRAVVTEDWRLVAGEDERVLARGRARYELRPASDGWRFSSGLM